MLVSTKIVFNFSSQNDLIEQKIKIKKKEMYIILGQVPQETCTGIMVLVAPILMPHELCNHHQQYTIRKIDISEGLIG